MLSRIIDKVYVYRDAIELKYNDRVETFRNNLKNRDQCERIREEQNI